MREEEKLPVVANLQLAILHNTNRRMPQGLQLTTKRIMTAIAHRKIMILTEKAGLIGHGGASGGERQKKNRTGAGNRLANPLALPFKSKTDARVYQQKINRKIRNQMTHHELLGQSLTEKPENPHQPPPTQRGERKRGTKINTDKITSRKNRKTNEKRAPQIA
ncbi:MAG: hypothetical protein D8H94_03400 [Cardiobacterium sp.]|nr:MAG: hypothetical protein D8H94_03400 [Cardiobacterium sp.]